MDLIPQADSSSVGQDLYANHIQVYITRSEIMLDFYVVGPNYQGNPNAKIVKRILIPLNMAKGLTSALANLILDYEKDNKTELPNLRSPDEGDLIDIWKK